MSDPTIQTFCCHHTGNTDDMAVKIMNELNTDSYNSVCLFSSAIGMFGAMYQVSVKILIFCLFHDRNACYYNIFFKGWIITFEKNYP